MAGILNLSFNQLVSHLVCCTDQGHIIFALEPELQKKTNSKMGGGIGKMKMFNRTNIAALVGGGDNPYKSKNRLILFDIKNKRSIFEVDLLEPVKNVLIKGNFVIGVLENKLCAFDYSGKLIGTKTTYLNEQGLAAIVRDEDNPAVVTLGENKGELSIWYPVSEESRSIKDAHISNIDALAINHNGSLVATASEKGTLIRVFNTSNGKIKYEFRRGTFQAKIHDLAFNKDSTRLACTSGNGTVHIYEMTDDEINTKNVQSMFSGLKNYLPVVGSQWSFKQGSVDTTAKTICGFDDENVLHVASYDGKYFKMSGKNDAFENIYTGTIHTNYN